MYTSNRNKPINYLLGLTLTSAIITLSGCGGGGSSSDSKDAVDVSGVTDLKLKESLKDGLTNGLSSNVDSLGSTLSTVNDSFNSSSPKYLTKSSKTLSDNQLAAGTSNDAVGGLNTITDNTVGQFNLLIDNSTSTNSGNVYTFNPDEATICADPLLDNDTSAKVADCISVLSHITFISTINAVDSNNYVTAADTVFKYDTSEFSKLGFTGNSSYYQVELGGMSALLTGLNSVASQDDQLDLPDSMSGALRIASSAQTATSGTLTLSVPSDISVTDTAPQTAINIASTASLLSVTADSTANTMDLNIGINALDFLFTDEDDQGNTFPQQLLLNALSGQAVVSNNGNTVTLTGITADGVQLKIDGTQALGVDLTSLNAVIDASSLNQKTVTLSSPLNFSMATSNVRGFIDDSLPQTNTMAFSASAPANTSITEVTSTIDDLVKVTAGSVTINKTATGQTTINTTVPTGSCLNTDSLAIDNSANCQ